MYLNYFVEIVLPIITLIVAVWALLNSWKANRVQNRVNKLEEKIKECELERLELERETEKEALIEARAYKMSKDKYRVKFWNSGKGTAYDVNFKLPLKGTEGLIRRNKVPYEFLEPGKSFEEVLIVLSGAPNKFEIITIWKDESGVEKSKKGIISF